MHTNVANGVTTSVVALTGNAVRANKLVNKIDLEIRHIYTLGMVPFVTASGEVRTGIISF